MKPLPIKHFSLFPPSNTLTCIVIFIMPHQCSKRNDPIRRGSKSRAEASDGTRREGRALKGETGPKVGRSGMIAERGKEGAGRIGSRKAENRRGPTPGVAAPAEIGTRPGAIMPAPGRKGTRKRRGCGLPSSRTLEGERRTPQMGPAWGDQDRALCSS